MKHTFMLTVLLLSAPVVAQNAEQTAISVVDRAAISAPLDVYVKAQEKGDGALLLTAFTNDAMLIGADKSGNFKSTIQ